jgi:cytochrome c-type biogenesis protein CcmE
VKLGAIIAFMVALTGVAIAIFAFVATATPYVSAKEAQTNPGLRVHVAGSIDHATVRNDVQGQKLYFDLIDDQGTKMSVVYLGVKPSNFDSAPKATVAGTYKEGAFYAKELRTQCPSKYETESKTP